MTLAAEKELQHLGETQGCADHDHDMVHELSRRLDAIWRYDQYIANAAGFFALSHHHRPVFNENALEAFAWNVLRHGGKLRADRLDVVFLVHLDALRQVVLRPLGDLPVLTERAA